jgi:hypothetical protein
MGKFTVKSIVPLNDVVVGQEFPESDFVAHAPNGNFVQFEYHDDDENKIPTTSVTPGIWEVVKTLRGLELQPTEFTKDNLLEQFVNTQQIERIVECFIKNIHLYKTLGYDVAKRSIMLMGPPGTGKSTAIGKVCTKYANDKSTAVIIWHTDKFESHEIKDFIKGFQYNNGVEKIILVAEDLGGVEIENRRMGSDSSLLSLLDNSERTFTIPTLIITTTNFPEMFMSNIMNRYGRIDDKIKVNYPPASARSELLQFFCGNTATPEEIKLIESDDCKEFPPAFLKEVFIRSKLRDMSMKDVIGEIIDEVKEHKNAYQERNGRFGL